MAGRTRLIKPSFWYDEDLGRASRDARLLAIGLLNLADREGRLEHKAGEIRVRLFPHDQLQNGELTGWLTELVRARFVLCYEVDGRKYLQIRNFARHQHCHPHEAKSVLPAPAVTCQDVSLHLLQGDLALRGTSTSTSTSKDLCGVPPRPAVPAHAEKRRRTKPANPSQPANVAAQGWIRDVWCPCFQHHMGAEFMPAWARDTKIIRELLKVHPPPDLDDLAEAFLEDRDEWLMNVGRDIPMFRSKINQLVSRRADYERTHPRASGSR